MNMHHEPPAADRKVVSVIRSLVRPVIFSAIAAVVVSGQALANSCCPLDGSQRAVVTSLTASSCCESGCQTLVRGTPDAVVPDSNVNLKAASPALPSGPASQHLLVFGSSCPLAPGGTSARASRASLVVLHAQFLI